jgi:hypothetical protein
MIADLAVPAPGQNSDFDLFAASQLGDHTDVIDEQLNDLCEMLTDGCGDPCIVHAELRQYAIELANDWRRGSWNEWCGVAAFDLSDEVTRLECGQRRPPTTVLAYFLRKRVVESGSGALDGRV